MSSKLEVSAFFLFKEVDLKLLDRFVNAGKLLFNNNVEEKSKQSDTESIRRTKLLDLFSSVGNLNVTPQSAYWLFEISDAIFKSVDMICWAFSQINPVLQHKESLEIITDHPILELENNPDPRIVKSALRYELMKSLCLTGEIFPVLYGNIKYEPVGIYHYPACNIDEMPGNDGYISELTATNYNNQKVLRRNLRDKKYVFQDSIGMTEIRHIYYSLKRNTLRAQSPLEQILYQVLTKHYGHIHNTAMVKNGNRPSGILSPKDTNMRDDQYMVFKENVKNTLSDPVNAGECITSPQPIDYINLMLSTKDMDFALLLSESKVDIYNQFSIPLPLVLKETMTLNNYGEAIKALFDFAVLPKASFIWENYGEYLLSRYEDGKELRFFIDERQLAPLRERLLARAKDLRMIESFSEDEIRNSVGFESLSNGAGNVIYRSAGKIPYSNEDVYFNDRISYEDSLSKPEIDETDEIIEDVIDEEE